MLSHFIYDTQKAGTAVPAFSFRSMRDLNPRAVARGIETGDMNEAIKAAEMASSKGFKWGAISGAVIGGGKEAFALKRQQKMDLP